MNLDSRGLLWVASVVASILVIPYSVHFLRQMRGKPSLESLQPQIAEGVAEGAILSMLMIALGLACGKSVGLDWPPLDGWDKGPDNRRRMRAALKLAVILSVVAVGFDVALGYVIHDRHHLEGHFAATRCRLGLGHPSLPLIEAALIVPRPLPWRSGNSPSSTARSIRALCALRLNRIRSFGMNLHPLPRSDTCVGPAGRLSRSASTTRSALDKRLADD